jgi:hypothetical protein
VCRRSNWHGLCARPFCGLEADFDVLGLEVGIDGVDLERGCEVGALRERVKRQANETLEGGERTCGDCNCA